MERVYLLGRRLVKQSILRMIRLTSNTGVPINTGSHILIMVIIPYDLCLVLCSLSSSPSLLNLVSRSAMLLMIPSDRNLFDDLSRTLLVILQTSLKVVLSNPGQVLHQDSIVPCFELQFHL